jgi:hypothetical protein
VLLVVGSALLFVVMGFAGTASAAGTLVCYTVADRGGAVNGGTDSSDEDLATKVNPADHNPATDETSLGTGTHSYNVEAAALNAAGVFYAMDANQLGVVNLSTGVFTPTSQKVGSGQGSLGTVSFNDNDGLTFGPDGTLWATLRRDSGPDLLLKVDPSTGAHVPDAFGSGVDYLVIQPLGSRDNIDDIAIPPGGPMYALANNGGHDDHLVTLNPATGAVTDVGPLNVNDMEGLAVNPLGGLIGTTGQESTAHEGLWDINPTTGAATNDRPLDNGQDYEAVSCLLASGPAPSPSPTVLPTQTSTGPGPGPTTSVLPTEIIAGTGPGNVMPLTLAGLMMILAGVTVLLVTPTSGRHRA